MLLVAFLVYVFFLSPFLDELRAVEAEVAAYEGAVMQAATFNTLLNQLDSKQASLSALEREQLDLLVPAQFDEVRTLVDLERLARVHGLIFSNVTAGLAEVPATAESRSSRGGGRGLDQSGEYASGGNRQLASWIEHRNIAIAVTGTYEQFRSFLRDLEQSLVLIEVEGLTFSRPTALTEGETDFMTYQLTLRLSRLNPDALR